MNSHSERGVINHLTKRREKSPLKGLEMKRIKFRLWERSMTSLLSQLHSLEAERDDLQNALQQIAKYPSKPDEELGYTGCRMVAKAALVKQSYRDLAKIWHPDHNTDAEALENFQKIKLLHKVEQQC